MPYLDISISTSLSETQKQSLVALAGQAIVQIPGKSEEKLMIRISDEQALYFRGRQDRCAMIRLDLYLAASQAAKTAFVEAFMGEFMTITGLNAEQIYMAIQEHGLWVNGTTLK